MTSKIDDTEKENANSRVQENDENEVQSPKPDPTRYGDWEKNGRCIDF